MKLPYALAPLMIFSLVIGCEKKETVEEKREVTVVEPAPPPPQPAEGPAERLGKVVDRAIEEAGQAVGEGLEKAGREVKKSSDRFVPESQPEQD